MAPGACFPAVDAHRGHASRFAGRAWSGIAVMAAASWIGGAPRLQAQPSTASAPETALLFERSRAVVFLVETDRGSGSGFLVDGSGFILTNAHLVAKSRYLAVRIDPRRKFPAQLVASDPDRDIAVIRLNPSAVAGLQPLSLAVLPPAGRETLVGERVLAIGNPFDTENMLTTGVVSQITIDAIISDVHLHPGNSGGPLLDLEGRAIGMNTFARTPHRPASVGIVRIHYAEPLLAEARAKAARESAPEAELLPVASDRPFPGDALRRLLTTDPKPKHYGLDAAKVKVQFLTPPLQHSLAMADQRRAEERQRKKDKKSGPGPEAAEEADHRPRAYDAVVTVRAMPEVGMTTGSKIGRLFAPAGITTPAHYRFKTDFKEMKLLRAGKEVRPIMPGRVCQHFKSGWWETLDDTTCFGLYQYPPEVFAPDAPLELHVFIEEESSQATVRVLKPELLKRIWADFEPFFESAGPPE